jgi:type IV secretory pathway TrbD component
MKEEILKSVASPMQLFFAPFKLVILNAAASFAIMLLLLVFNLAGYVWIGIAFFCIMHLFLVALAKWEPHIGNILAAKSRIGFKTKSPVKEPGDKFAP